jgi:hypothetical protein
LNKDPNQKMSGGSDVFDYRGGTHQGSIQPNTDGGFADAVSVDISVEYTAESGLPILQQTKSLPVTPTGARYVLELPHRRLIEFEVFFDLPHGVVRGDYMMLNWSYLHGGSIITARVRVLREKELLGFPGTLAGSYKIGFIADPAPTAPELFHLEVDGKYYGSGFPKFKADYPLTQPSIMLFLKENSEGGGYHIEA